MSDIKLSESNTSSQNYKIKSFTGYAILILLVIGALLLSGKLGPNFFVVVLFVLIVLIPVFIIFRKNLVNVLPKPLADNLLEIDERQEEAKKQKKVYEIKRVTREIGMYILVTVLLLGAFFQLYLTKYSIKEKKSLYTIFGALACIILSGVIILEFEHISNYFSGKRPDITTPTNIM